MKITETDFMKLVSIARLHKLFYNPARKLEFSLSFQEGETRDLFFELFQVLSGEAITPVYLEQVNSILRTAGKL